MEVKYHWGQVYNRVLVSDTVLDLSAPKRWKAELTWVVGYVLRQCWPACRQSPIQVLTGPDVWQVYVDGVQPVSHYTTPLSPLFSSVFL